MKKFCIKILQKYHKLQSDVRSNKAQEYHKDILLKDHSIIFVFYFIRSVSIFFSVQLRIIHY